MCGSKGIDIVTTRLPGPPLGCETTVPSSSPTKQECIEQAWKIINAKQAVCRTEARKEKWECERFRAKSRCHNVARNFANRMGNKCQESIVIPEQKLTQPPACRKGGKGRWLGGSPEQKPNKCTDRANKILNNYIKECHQIRLTSKATNCVIDFEINECLLKGYTKKYQLTDSCQNDQVKYTPVYIKRNRDCPFRCLDAAKQSFKFFSDFCHQ